MAGYMYVRLTQYGLIGSSQTWSTSIGIEPSQEAPPAPSQLNDWLAALDAPLKSWWTTASSVGAQNGTNIKYVGARAYSYPIDSTSASAQADHPFTNALLGTGGSGSLPTQTSLCSSMLSNAPGRSFRGRRYLPMTSSNLASNQLGSATVDIIVAAEVALLNAINATVLGGGTGSCVIINKKDFPQVIRTVRIDSEPDVQRRRADKIIANYSKNTALA